jgi:hypothetical protein
VDSRELLLFLPSLIELDPLLLSSLLGPSNGLFTIL